MIIFITLLKRDRLNDIICTLEHHFHQDNEEIEVTTMQNFNLNEQYEKKQQVSMEIPIIIKHIKINKK